MHRRRAWLCSRLRVRDDLPLRQRNCVFEWRSKSVCHVNYAQALVALFEVEFGIELVRTVGEKKDV